MRVATVADYDIALGNTATELRENVKEMMKQGFVPQGGIAVERRTWTNERKGYEELETWYSQAMIKPYGLG